MKVNASLLARFRANRAARRELAAAGQSTADLDTAKKAIWADVHRQYGIPGDTKLKIELDGDLAGELRHKDGRVYGYNQPTTNPATVQPVCDVVAGTKFTVSDGDDSFVVDNVDELIACLNDNYDIRVVKVPA